MTLPRKLFKTVQRRFFTLFYRSGFVHWLSADHLASPFTSVRHLQQPAPLHLAAAIVADDDVTLHRARDEEDDQGRGFRIRSTDARLPVRVLQPASARSLGTVPAAA